MPGVDVDHRLTPRESELPRYKVARTGCDIVGISFDLLDYADVFRMIQQWIATRRQEYVCLTNPHCAMLCQRHDDMRRATQGASLILPDGVGIILAAKILRLPHRGRVTGPELMLRICDWGRQFHFRHYFLGGGEGVADKLATRLSDRYPGLIVAGTMSPPFRALSVDEDTALVQQVNAARPDLLWVGLGAPKQENWMANHFRRIESTAMIGVGAAFDFHSGTIPWAPPWVRRWGLEWMHRLVRNPMRMWRRNLDSFRFLYAVLKQRCTGPVHHDD